MKALYWTIYIVSLFGLGYLIAHVTRPKSAKKVTVRSDQFVTSHKRQPRAVNTMHLDLDFTQFESKK